MTRPASSCGWVLIQSSRARCLCRSLRAEAVVEEKERFPVAGRSTNVRENHRAPKLIEEVIVSSLESGARLRFGTAVDVDNHRTRSREFFRVGLIEKAADLASIERFPGDQLWLDKTVGWNAAGLTHRPAGRDVPGRVGRPGVDIGRRARAVHIEGEQVLLRAVLPFQPGNDRSSDRRVKDRIGLRGRGHFSVAHRDSDNVKRARAVFVQSVGDALAIAAQIPIVDVPLRIGQQVSVRFAREIDVGEALKFRVPVGRDEDAFAILREKRLRVGDLFRAGSGSRSQLPVRAPVFVSKSQR